MSSLPIQPAHALPVCPEESRWLIDALWGEEAVGIVGGEPKCCKSFLALDMAIAVASGRPCLRRFPVLRPGRVLLFAAEDALHIVRRRVEGICAAAAVPLDRLDLYVITAPSLRLDLESDRQLLEQAITRLTPRLLVLDPFVRLHRGIDENASGEVAPLLAFLREMQRVHHVAVAVVHHAKKGAGSARAGQALRGSSEFHAWGDSNLYLRRVNDALTLSIEHRAAPSRSGLPLGLCERGEALALEVLVQPHAPAEPKVIAPLDRVIQALAAAAGPLTFSALRDACRMRTQSVTAVLAQLLALGRIAKTAEGYTLATN
jgi:hypothetical protein